MKRFLSILLLFCAFAASAQHTGATYINSTGQVSSKPIAINGSIPANNKEKYYDNINFNYRSYRSAAEVLSYLPPQQRYQGLKVWVDSCGAFNSTSGVLTPGCPTEYVFDGGLQLKTYLDLRDSTLVRNTDSVYLKALTVQPKLRVYSISNSSAKASWTKPVDAEYYELLSNTVDEFTTAVSQYIGSMGAFIQTGLASAQQYFIYLKSVFAPYTLSGKTVAFIGDSFIQLGLPQPAFTSAGLTQIYSDGVGGSCIVTGRDNIVGDGNTRPSIYSRVDAWLASNADVFIFQGGNNDWGAGFGQPGWTQTPLGNKNSTNTAEFYGALNKIVAKCRNYKVTHPNVIFIALTRMQTGAADTTPSVYRYANQELYCNPLLEVFGGAGMLCIDPFHNSGIKVSNISQYATDFVHPVQDPSVYRACIAGFLQQPYMVDRASFITNNQQNLTASVYNPNVQNVSNTWSVINQTTGGNFNLGKILFNKYLPAGMDGYIGYTAPSHSLFGGTMSLRSTNDTTGDLFSSPTVAAFYLNKGTGAVLQKYPTGQATSHVWISGNDYYLHRIIPGGQIDIVTRTNSSSSWTTVVSNVANSIGDLFALGGVADFQAANAVIINPLGINTSNSPTSPPGNPLTSTSPGSNTTYDTDRWKVITPDGSGDFNVSGNAILYNQVMPANTDCYVFYTAPSHTGFFGGVLGLRKTATTNTIVDASGSSTALTLAGFYLNPGDNTNKLQLYGANNAGMATSYTWVTGNDVGYHRLTNGQIDIVARTNDGAGNYGNWATVLPAIQTSNPADVLYIVGAVTDYAGKFAVLVNPKGINLQ